MAQLADIQYVISPWSPERHLFEVICTVGDPDPAGQQFKLPAWTPGSYLIRDYARHVVSIQARRGRIAARMVKLDKHTWIAEPGSGPLSVTMQVYAWDLPVRGAHLDQTHAFFNGPCVFLRAIGKESRACTIDIRPPKGARYRDWRVATSMQRRGAPAYGFGIYRAADYDELIDHPVEMGTFALYRFTAAGVAHDVAVTGRHRVDSKRLTSDLTRLCEQQIALFGAPAPFVRYVFLVTALGEGYGGLEHRASTALLCARDDLPEPGIEQQTESYRTFLGLCSHEYFHAWNVKRIKPAAFTPYDLERENYTSLLWAFEGLTSYYDDLELVRAGLISQTDYFDTLARSITALLRTPGRMQETVSEASYDAWIKYYRQDENSPNAQVSYYLKGSLIGLCLDLTIRDRTHGRRSLDDVMRALWQRYGQTGVGVPEDGVERVAEEVAGARMRNFFDRALRSAEELPLKSSLARVGLAMELRSAESISDKGGKGSGVAAKITYLGARTADDQAGLRLTHVLDGGPAQAAGLWAGDVIVALDAMKLTSRNLDKRLRAYASGDRVKAHVFRRDELLEVQIVLAAAPLDTCAVSVSNADRSARNRRQAWLKGSR
ncbi:MAG: PDZ domain-containing protein [Betaproteobacteria bacterium]